MNESGGGAGFVPRSEFDFFRSEFHDLKTESNQRFSDLSTKIDTVLTTITNRLDTMQSAAVANTGGDLDKFVKVAGVLLVLAGGVGTLVKMNIDTNVQAAQDRTATVDKNLSTAIAVQGDQFKAALGAQGAQIQAMLTSVVPRPELDYRITRNVDDIRRVTDVQTQHVGEIARLAANADNLKADVERLKNDIVTRKENESHWNDLQNRLMIAVERLNDLQKESSGATLSEQLQTFRTELQNVRGELSQLQSRFLITPGDGTAPQKP